MLTIYYDNQKAIVANEQTRKYRTMSLLDARAHAKGKQVRAKSRQGLSGIIEMLLNAGFEEEE